MTYIQSRNNRGRGAKAATFFAFFILAVIALITFIWPHFFPAFWTSFAKPFWRGQAMISMGSLSSRAELLAENERLNRELATANIRLESVQAIELENSDLRTILGKVSTSTGDRYILGAVLKRPPAAPFDELIIDLGSRDGAKIGALVYAPGPVIIGRVEDVLLRTSKVILFSSPKEKHEVFIGQGRASATAIGRGGGQYYAELPRDVVVSEGDAVISSDLSNRLFGKVSSIENDAAQPFETIYFGPPVNVFEIKWVLLDMNLVDNSAR